MTFLTEWMSLCSKLKEAKNMELAFAMFYDKHDNSTKELIIDTLHLDKEKIDKYRILK